MKRASGLIGAIFVLSALWSMSGCSFSILAHSEDDASEVQWESGMYPGQKSYGISAELSNALKEEYERAVVAGKGDLFLDAIMGFGKVSKTENRTIDGIEIQTIYLFLQKVKGIYVPTEKGEKKETIDYYQPLCLEDAQIFLNGEPASIDDIKPGDFVSYWGIDMNYQPEDIYPQEIRGVTLIIGLSPDYIGSKMSDVTL